MLIYKLFYQAHTDGHTSYSHITYMCQTTCILTQMHSLITFSLRHTDYSHSHSDTQHRQLPYSLKTHRLLYSYTDYSQSHTDYSHSHTDTQTTPILTQDTQTTPILTLTHTDWSHYHTAPRASHLSFLKVNAQEKCQCRASNWVPGGSGVWLGKA